MGATEAFELPAPTAEDLEAATLAWHTSHSRRLLPTGSTWWRVLRSGSAAEAVTFAQTYYASDANNRFTPVYESGNIVPAAYAAQTRETALWESVLRFVRHEGIRRIPRRETRDRYLIEVKLTRDIQLLDIRRPCDMRLVAATKRPPELSRAWPQAYVATRAWAQALLAHIPEIEGLIYESHQISASCAVLYQRSRAVAFAADGIPLPVDAEPVRSMLEELADEAGAVVDFED